MRSPRLDVEPPFRESCRFHEVWVKINTLSACVITIYGFIDRDSDGKGKNEILLNYALQRAAQAGKFVIIAGDFNNSLRNTPYGHHFRTRGFVDTLRWAQHAFPHATQPTCGNSTFNDTILLSQEMFQFVQEAKVLGDQILLFINRSLFHQTGLAFRYTMNIHDRSTLPHAMDCNSACNNVTT